MKKKILIGTLILAILFSVVLSSCFSAPAAGGDGALTIHYYRADQQYTGWNLWVWHSDPGEEGNGFLFGPPNEEGWVSSTIPMPSFVREYGYIVRLSVPGDDWAQKDINDDRFSRVREIWVVSGDPRTYTTKPNLGR